MYRIGTYNAGDRMCDVVFDRYAVLLVMSRFGIGLGFGDRTVGEVCRDEGVDTATFLAVVNQLAKGDEGPDEDPAALSVEGLLSYLRRSHSYFLTFRLPAIRRKLLEAIGGCQREVGFAIVRFFDEYVAEVHKHMDYEERHVFPYVENLLADSPAGRYTIDIFRRHHDRIEAKLSELKRILIRYYPAGGSNELNGVLFDIFLCEEDLASHNAVEDRLFIPAIERLERLRGEPASAHEGGADEPCGQKRLARRRGLARTDEGNRPEAVSEQPEGPQKGGLR